MVRIVATIVNRLVYAMDLFSRINNAIEIVASSSGRQILKLVQNPFPVVDVNRVKAQRWIARQLVSRVYV